MLNTVSTVRCVAGTWGFDMKDSKGYSLLEIMMALVILSVGLLALVQMQGVFAKGSGDARYITRAMDVGMSKMEELKNVAYSDPILNDGSHSDTDSSFGKQFQITWNVNTTGTTNNIKEIELTVTWSSGSDSKSVTLNNVRPRIE